MNGAVFEASEWRWVYEKSPRPHPAAQMAIDAAVMDSVMRGAAPSTVRLYCWDRRIVTVGRMQDIGDARRTYPGDILVRRMTGGNAVVHGDDLTLSVIAPQADLKKVAEGGGVLATHDVVVRGLERALRRIGVATIRGCDERGPRGIVDCFSHVARCDLRSEATGKKLVGSAQLRKNGIVLQQMSLRPPLGIDPHGKPFIRALLEEMTSALKVATWQFAPVREEEEAQAALLADSWEIYGF
ncbi:MAG: hypothetical protein P4L33_14635 [Capsulimonadaceae bacterium]|nr:hypothetical protein [Capsulimonadaceae bacterium]